MGGRTAAHRRCCLMPRFARSTKSRRLTGS